MVRRRKKDSGSPQEMTFDEEIRTEIIPNLPLAGQLLFLSILSPEPTPRLPKIRPSQSVTVRRSPSRILSQG